MTHSYEEIRKVAIELLAGHEAPTYCLTQYEHFRLSVGGVFSRREGINSDSQFPPLDREDNEIFLEVFWDLFRQGIITLGLNHNSPNFPWFRVTGFGKKILENQSGYFFHDVSSYENVIKSEIPLINETTLLYLKEAMQSFRSGCLLSASVMLGVATEHTFELLLESTQENPTWAEKFFRAVNEKGALRRINKFKKILEENIRDIPREIKEDLDTNFAGIISVIRNFRNESGHPTGKIVSREQAFVLLQLFIPYCKKIYELMDFFRILE
jgi:hypothetical protein